MAYPDPFIRITAFGRLGSPTSAETWSASFKLGYMSDTTDPTTFLEAIAPAFSTFHASNNVGAGPNTFLTELHGAVIGTDGHYVGGATQATKIHMYGTPVAGAGSGALPWPTAAVISLRVTGRTRGPASHGRMYWPACGLQVDSTTGKFFAMNNAATAAQALLNQANSLAKTHFGPGTCIINTSKVGSGTQAAVNQILVGDRPDHQERRENAFKENYVTRSITV